MNRLSSLIVALIPNVIRYHKEMSKNLFGSALGGTLYRTVFQSTPVYIAFVLSGAFVAEQMFDKAMNGMWRSHNKGKFFEDIKPASE